MHHEAFCVQQRAGSEHLVIRVPEKLRDRYGLNFRVNDSPLVLAEAQFLVARELRFENWAALKRHIAEMTLAREAMSVSVLDSDLRTLHIRCGADLKDPLQAAGFHGDFYDHTYPYLLGPVREGPDSLRQRARFIVEKAEQERIERDFEMFLRDVEEDEGLRQAMNLYKNEKKKKKSQRN